jgi:hypothetical protein
MCPTMALEASLTHISSQRLPLSPAHRSTATAERADACCFYARLQRTQATFKSTLTAPKPRRSGREGNKCHLPGDFRWTLCCNAQSAVRYGTYDIRRLSCSSPGEWRYCPTYGGNSIFTLSASCYDAYCGYMRRNRWPDRGNDTLSSGGPWSGYSNWPDSVLENILPSSSCFCWLY